jgi:hypothetical protein
MSCFLVPERKEEAGPSTPLKYAALRMTGLSYWATVLLGGYFAVTAASSFTNASLRVPFFCAMGSSVG